MEEKGLSPTQFADGVEVPRAVVSHILSGRNKPSLDVILKILSAHRDVSMNWLLLGDGQMYASESSGNGDSITPEKVTTRLPEPDKPDEAQSPHRLPEVGQPIPQQVNKTDSKNIERIVYFYSDKTFEVFTAF